MDVSGSMGADQKELVRIESFWLDAWISNHYQGTRSVYIVHDAAAKEVDRDTFFRIRESGGTVISSAYELAVRIIGERFPAAGLEPLPVPLHRRRELQPPGHREVPGAAATSACCRRLNLFGYGQVESYGTSGDFYEAAAATLPGRRAGGAVAHSRPRRDRRFDQDLPRHGDDR